jgi:hypothetical protein
MSWPTIAFTVLPTAPEGRFVNAGEIQLGFGRDQRVHGNLALHQRKQSRHCRGLPLQQQPRTGSGSVINNVFLNAFHGYIDVVLYLNTAKADVQLAATDCAREAAAFVADWNTVRASCVKASRPRS